MDAGGSDQQPTSPSAPVAEGAASSAPPEVINAEAAALLDKLAAQERDIDVEDIDLFLDQQDPHFKLALDSIGQDTELRAVDVEADNAAQAYYEELEKWKNSSGLPKLIFRFFPVAPRISLALKLLFFKAKRSVIANWIRVKNWSHDFILLTAKRASTSVKETSQAWSRGFKKGLRDYKFMSWKLKLQLYLTILLGLGGLVGVYMVYKGKLMPRDHDLFIATMEDVATGSYHYNPGEDQEYFYDNIRSVPNLFLIPKIVTNIRPSNQSGPTPMMAVEFFAEGFNPEVIIEMKDREPQIRDLSQRAIEEFSFDELESQSGKQKMIVVLTRELNRILTTGQVKTVRIKTIILKP